MMNEEEEMQQSLDEKCKNATFTLDFVISGKKFTLKDIHLCQNCQLDIRDKIEDIIFTENIKDGTTSCFS